MSVPHASGYFRTSYARDLVLLDTRAQRVACAVFLRLALSLPGLDAPFLRDRAPPVLRAVIGSVALMPVNGGVELIVNNGVPYNELHDRNYPSIGCTHCTKPVMPGEDPRSGRWQGFDKTECGLHVPDSDSTEQLASAG